PKIKLILSQLTYKTKVMKMKKFYSLLLFVFILQSPFAFSQKKQWNLVGDKITTAWAKEVNPSQVLTEYPRPQLERENWKNLNGLWSYAIRPKNAISNATYDGEILVPFAVESALSGVGKTVGKDSILWYQTSFSLPSNFRGKRILLHFGAVDWETEVFINERSVGKHQGGFDPFTFDITDYITKGNQQITVKVWDPTDEGPQPIGKQVRNPKGIWYTPVTGIWQTVWLEAVPESYIVSTKQSPDIDKERLNLTATIENAKA